MPDDEIWRAIEGYGGYYEVSNCGRVRSVDRRVRHVSKKGKESLCTRPGRLIKQFSAPNGYLKVSLSREGKVRNWMTHRLVAGAFCTCPDGATEVNHRDGDKHNNSDLNLHWVTGSENKKHAYQTGLRPVGALNHFSELERDKSGRCIARDSMGLERKEIEVV